MHAEITSQLQIGSPEAIREAARLCDGLGPHALDAHEDTVHLVLQTAWALEQMGDVPDATRFYRQIMHCKAGDRLVRANACYRYGLHQEAAGKTAEALAAYERARKLATDDLIGPAARQQLVNLQIRTGQGAEALPMLQALLAEAGPDPETRLPLELQRLRVLVNVGRLEATNEEVLQLLPPAGAEVPAETMSRWQEAAIEMELANRYELAKEFYLRLQQVKGVSGRVVTDCHYRLGLMLEQLGQWASSLHHYRAAVEAPPDFPEAQWQARYHMAELQYLGEDYAAALEHLAILRSSTALSPTQRLESHFRYAVCLHRLGRPDEAIVELQDCQGKIRVADSGFSSKVGIQLAEIFEGKADVPSASREYEKIVADPYADQVIKASAYTRLEQLRHSRKRGWLR